MIFEFSSIPGLYCPQYELSVVGGSGFDICDEGQVKDTRGECKNAYQFSAPEEEVKPREIKKPTRRRNLREYLRSKYRF